MNKIIEVENLVKQYHKSEKKSVDDISFYVEEGAFFSFLGPNGAGKTTTISILTTTLAKTSGKVLIAGHEVSEEPDLVRQDIGVIFQNPSLDLNLTAEENLRFHTNLYHIYPYRPFFSLMPKAYKNKVSQLAEILGIQDSLFMPIKNLSGGMKRKFEIIRSLMHEPKILFLDEPTTGLDPISRRQLWDYLQEIRVKNNITIFLTTHYLEEAEGSDFIAIINNGKIVSSGSASKIKAGLLNHYIKVDAKDRDALQKVLESKKWKFTGTGAFEINLGEHTAQEIIQEIKIPLTTLEIHQPTLEQAYVNIIENA